MKRAILCAVLPILLFLAGCVTTMKAINEPMIIQRTIDVPGSQDDLYRLSNEWMARTYVASSHVIQYQDKEEGIVVGRAKTGTRYIGLGTYDFWYNMKIEARDDKVRVTLNDVYGKGEVLDVSATIKPEQMKQKDYDELMADFNETIDDLEAHLLQGPDEW